MASRRAGFTLIEIMIAMSIMIFGVMAIIELQAQTARTNTLARELGTATQIAQTALEKLKLDASTWTLVGEIAPNDPALAFSALRVLGRTAWLREVIANNFSWLSMGQVPATATATHSPAADFWGQEVTLTNLAARHFCTSMRVTWVLVGRTIRADVRVHWRKHKAVTAGGGDDLHPACVNPGDDSLDPDGVLAPDMHFVYLSTVIRRTEPVPQ